VPYAPRAYSGRRKQKREDSIMGKLRYDRLNKQKQFQDRGYSADSYSRIKPVFATTVQKELLSKLGVRYGRLISKKDATELILNALDKEDNIC
jgi:hypothetical protein